MLIRKKEGRRKKEKKEKKNKIKTFAFNFLHCQDKSWDFGAIFYIRIVKGFHQQEYCISSLCLSWSCSHTWSTGYHFKPAQSLLNRYYCTAWVISILVQGGCGINLTRNGTRGKGMVNRFVAHGYSNTPSNRVTLFKFPSDAFLLCSWEKQVQQTQAQWKAIEHSFLCSDHLSSSNRHVHLSLELRKGGGSSLEQFKQYSIDHLWLRYILLGLRSYPSQKKTSDAYAWLVKSGCRKEQRNCREERERLMV